MLPVFRTYYFVIFNSIFYNQIIHPNLQKNLPFYRTGGEDRECIFTSKFFFQKRQKNFRCRFDLHHLIICCHFEELPVIFKRMAKVRACRILTNFYSNKIKQSLTVTLNRTLFPHPLETKPAPGKGHGLAQRNLQAYNPCSLLYS